MKLNPLTSHSAIFTLLAAITFVACLGFAVERLFWVDYDLRTEEPHPDIWQVSQA